MLALRFSFCLFELLSVCVSFESSRVATSGGDDSLRRLVRIHGLLPPKGSGSHKKYGYCQVCWLRQPFCLFAMHAQCEWRRRIFSRKTRLLSIASSSRGVADSHADSPRDDETGGLPAIHRQPRPARGGQGQVWPRPIRSTGLSLVDEKLGDDIASLHATRESNGKRRLSITASH